jgi:dTDP-glucose 4,6-dehydratase/UDP-glucose 4-epimerase
MKPLPPDDLADIFQWVGDWRALQGARIFITGGTGFFGTWMLAALLHADRALDLHLRVTVLSRNPEAFATRHPELANSPSVRFVQGDVTGGPIPVEPCDYVMHLATTAASETFHGEDQLKKLETLYFGTRNVLNFAVASGAKKVLFTSSGVVYGPIDQFPEGVPESYLGGPDLHRADSALGEGKRVAEYLCAYYGEKYGLNCAIGRCFSFVGPLLPLDLHYAIGNFIFNAIHHQDIQIRGDGTPLRSYMYIADATAWLLRLLLSEKAVGVYNIGASKSIAVSELACMVRDVLAPTCEVRVQGASDHVQGNFQRSVYLPSVQRAKETLGVLEWTPLEMAIRKTADFQTLAEPVA